MARPAMCVDGVVVTGRRAGSGGQAAGESRARPPQEDVQEWVDASCGEQGVAVKVTDPAILEEVAVLLAAGRRPPRRAKTA